VTDWIVSMWNDPVGFPLLLLVAGVMLLGVGYVALFVYEYVFRICTWWSYYKVQRELDKLTKKLQVSKVVVQDRMYDGLDEVLSHIDIEELRKNIQNIDNKLQ
jgi:hypothetical protein